MSSIRVVALCVFRRGTKILVGSGFDEVSQERFFRPLGGSVEFGERTVDAVRREMREELHADIDNLVHLGVLETVFTYAGEPGHECVFIYDAQFVDEALYSADPLPLYEKGWGGEAVWLDLAKPIDAPLYPEGLQELLGAAPTGSSLGGSSRCSAPEASNSS